LKLLITGSSGYIGRVLSRYFARKGISVVGLDVQPDREWKNANFRFVECDVTDRTRLGRIVREEMPTHFIHLAYLMNPLHDERREMEIDVEGSKNAIMAADFTPTVRQFIEFSSASAYGAYPDNPLWLREKRPLRPGDYRYGINKKKVEELMNGFEKRDDLKLVVLRMCTLVGPTYHKKGGVVSLITRSPVLFRFGKEHARVQFLHEEDLCSIMELILDDPDMEGTYNLAPDSCSTVSELAPGKVSIFLPEKAARAITSLGWALRLSSMRAPAVTISAHSIVIDPNRMMRRFDYTFRYSTQEAFEETVRQRKERGTL